MSKEKRLQIRLSEAEYNKLESYATQKDISMAQVLRDYIKRLPHPKTLSAIFAVATIATLSFPTLLR
jgi:glucokinase